MGKFLWKHGIMIVPIFPCHMRVKNIKTLLPLLHPKAKKKPFSERNIECLNFNDLRRAERLQTISEQFRWHFRLNWNRISKSVRGWEIKIHYSHTDCLKTVCMRVVGKPVAKRKGLNWVKLDLKRYQSELPKVEFECFVRLSLMEQWLILIHKVVKS